MRPAKHRDAEIASDDQKHVARTPGHRRNITGLCHADEDRATYRGTMKYLLVGGDYDGSRLRADGEPPFIRVPVERNGKYAAWDFDTYTLRTLTGGPSHRISFYAWEKISNAEAIDLLIRNYKPAKP